MQNSVLYYQAELAYRREQMRRQWRPARRQTSKTRNQIRDLGTGSAA